jgi:hypothetical protein
VNNKTKPKEGEQKASTNQFITEMPGVGQAPTTGTPSVVSRRRASDMPGAPGQMPDSGAGATTNNDPNNPSAWSSDPTSSTGSSGTQQSGGYYSSPYAGGSGSSSYSGSYGVGSSNQVANSQTGGSVGSSLQAGRGSATQGSNTAIQMIQNILTSARPIGSQLNDQTTSGSLASGSTGNSLAQGGGLGTPASSLSSGGGEVIGAQIAGVASKLEADSIKSYNDHSKYNEWEFIYDRTKDKSLALGLSMSGGKLPGSTTGSTTGSGSSSTFGSSSFGSSSGSSSTFSSTTR